MDSTLKEAIEKAGGVAALGRAIGITSQAVSQWKRVPDNKVLKVEELSGVSRHLLRPDIFGSQEKA